MMGIFLLVKGHLYIEMAPHSHTKPSVYDDQDLDSMSSLSEIR